MAKGIPSGYTRFLERLLEELPKLAERQPDIAGRLAGARMMASDCEVSVPHPMMSTLRWSFRQNRKPTRWKIYRNLIPWSQNDVLVIGLRKKRKHIPVPRIVAGVRNGKRRSLQLPVIIVEVRKLIVRSVEA